MHSTLHPHLKRGLDFDDFHIDLEDAIEHLPADHYTPQERAAKRRRVEAIASQYLQGRPPVILSAGLRGPFNNGWKNPWARNIRIVKRSSDKANGALNQRDRPRGRDSSEGVSTAKRRSRKRTEVETRPEALRAASPETCRAAEDDLDIHMQDNSLNNIELPPATAPLPEEDDMSGDTDFFSANTGKCIRNRSPLTNPFWLRRPEAETHVGNQSTNGTANASPTRSRSRNGNSQPHKGYDLQLAPPKAPLCGQHPPSKVTVLEDWRSSASASMIISSPVKGPGESSHYRKDLSNPIDAQVQLAQRTEEKATTVEEPYQRTPSHLHIAAPVFAHEEPEAILHDKRKVQHAQRTVSSETHRMGHTRSKEGSTDGEALQSIHRPKHFTSQESTSSIGSQSRPSREDVQRSAERLVSLMPTSSARSQQPRRSIYKSPKDKGVRMAPRHDLIASPAPASSTGFVYRKIGESKRTGTIAQKSKPQTTNLNSSPALKKHALIVPDQSPQNMTVIQEDGPSEKELPVTSIIKVQEGPIQHSGGECVEVNGTDVQQEQHSTRSTRSSTFSTQAAMLLAQIQFQESTHPASSDTPRPWSQSPHDTPQPIFPEPSPAITPLSVFSAQPDKSFWNNSALRGPPISTQDLFNAASPFAFSTVKKKPEMLQQSSLRSALLRNNDEKRRADGTSAKSPTPSADRVPLKAKNISAPLWSFVNEKASQALEHSVIDRSRRSISDVEFPSLDFRTSLGGCGSQGDLHFTDRFLRNLDDT